MPPGKRQNIYISNIISCWEEISRKYLWSTSIAASISVTCPDSSSRQHYPFVSNSLLGTLGINITTTDPPSLSKYLGTCRQFKRMNGD